MLKDLTLTAPDRPGAGADIFTALAEAGVNVDGVCGFPHRGQTWAVLHVLVEDVEGATRVLESRGYEVREVREVLVVDVLENRAGILAALFREFAERDVNIDLVYMAMGSRLVIGTSDMHDAVAGVRTVEASFGA